MGKMMKKVDVLPGWKTIITGIVTVIFQALALYNIVDLSEETVARVTDGLLALIGIFLAAKIERGKA